MRTWNEIKKDYISYVDRRALKQPERRIAALNKVEEYIRITHPGVFKGHALFAALNKDDLKQKFEVER